MPAGLTEEERERGTRVDRPAREPLWEMSPNVCLPVRPSARERRIGCGRICASSEAGRRNPKIVPGCGPNTFVRIDNVKPNCIRNARRRMVCYRVESISVPGTK
jgi:hypothetical protein